MDTLQEIVERNNALSDITLSFNALREEGQAYIAQLGHQLWTDFNVHDPGITILEVLCFAINDLAFRTYFDIEDLLAYKNPQEERKQFFTAAEILTCCPVTPLDYRKVLIDIDGVKNAWLLKAGARGQCLYMQYKFVLEDESPATIRAILDTFSSILTALEGRENTISAAELKTMIDSLIIAPMYRERMLRFIIDRYIDSESVYILRESITDFSQFIDSVLSNATYASILKPPSPRLRVYDIEQEIDAAVEAELEDLSDELRAKLETSRDLIPLFLQCFLDTVILFEEDKETIPLDAEGLNGLYEICLELEDHVNPEDTLSVERIKEQVLERLCALRNLCEDVAAVDVVGIKPICIDVTIVAEDRADEEEIHAQIIYNIQQFLSPRLEFYSLKEMFDRGKTCDEIFQGTILNHGFLDSDEVKNARLRRVIYKSDLYQEIMDVAGVQAVKKLDVSLCREEDRADGYRNNWCLDICQKEQFEADVASGTADSYEADIVCKHKPLLDIRSSSIKIQKGGVTIPVNQQEVKEKLDLINQINRKPPVDEVRDNAIPRGVFKDIDQYESIQEDFPLVYRTGINEVPDSFSTERKALVKQLKAFLTFFDQILANYLAQLGELKHILSSCPTPEDRTLFVKSLKGLDPGIDELFIEMYQINDAVLESLQDVCEPEKIERLAQLKTSPPLPRKTYVRIVNDTVNKEIADDGFLQASLIENYYETTLQEIVENPLERSKRRNKILDHLIARFGETFTDYALSICRVESQEPCKAGPVTIKDELLRCKTEFLKTIPKMGSYRGKGVNYKAADCLRKELFWNTDNVSGLKTRVSKKLCLKQSNRHQLSCPPNIEVSKKIDAERKCFYLVVIEKNKNPNAPDTTIYLQGLKDYTLRAKGKKEIDKIWNALLMSHQDDQMLSVTQDPETGLWYLELKSEGGESLARSAFVSEDDANNLKAEVQARIFPEECRTEGFHVVEHLLMRPTSDEVGLLEPFLVTPSCSIGDPYSFWISVVALDSWKRFSEENQARQFFEQVVRRETPAHIGICFLWLSGAEMYQFEFAYKNWLYDLARQGADDCQIEKSLNALVAIMNALLAKKTPDYLETLTNA